MELLKGVLCCSQMEEWHKIKSQYIMKLEYLWYKPSRYVFHASVISSLITLERTCFTALH